MVRAPAGERFIAVTAVGRDRPGIVAEFSGAIFRSGANLEDATMTRLRGEFAILLLLRVPGDASLSALEAALRAAAERVGLTVMLRPLAPDEAVSPEGLAPEMYMLRLHGADRPGIVHAITSLLADHGLNITDLNTRVLPGPVPVYVMLLEVEAPSAPAAECVRPELERRARELGVEVTFDPLAQEIL